jgi:hypothetical protein
MAKKKLVIGIMVAVAALVIIAGLYRLNLNKKEEAVPEYAPGEVVLYLNDGVPRSVLDEFIGSRPGLSVLSDDMADIGIYLIGVPEGEEKRWAGELESQDFTESASINPVIEVGLD